MIFCNGHSEPERFLYQVIPNECEGSRSTTTNRDSSRFADAPVRNDPLFWSSRGRRTRNPRSLHKKQQTHRFVSPSWQSERWVWKGRAPSIMLVVRPKREKKVAPDESVHDAKQDQCRAEGVIASACSTLLPPSRGARCKPGDRFFRYAHAISPLPWP